MTSDQSQPDSASPASPSPETPAGGLLARYRWLGYVLPMAVFLIVGSFEPSPPEVKDAAAAQAEDTKEETPKPANDPAGKPATDPASEPADDDLLLDEPKEESADKPVAIPEKPKQTAEEAKEDEEEGGWFDFLSFDLGLDIPYEYYPLIYTVKIALTSLAVFFVWPVYRSFPWKWSILGVATGLAGGVLWIMLCNLHLEPDIVKWLGMEGMLGDSGGRAAFNPFEALADRPLWMFTFLAIRFYGLVLLVAVIEEFFLRGFVLRIVAEPDWWTITVGAGGGTILAAAAIYGVLTHPGEFVAAAAWFTLVTFLSTATRNIWDCVLAHAITNFMLGVYVLITGEWRLW